MRGGLENQPPLICMNVIKKIRYSATPPITTPKASLYASNENLDSP